MKTIKVVAAIIVDSLDNPSKIFITQRAKGEFKGLWEFPGGKVEANETLEEALKREIMEELGVDILVSNLVTTIEYVYDSFHLSMPCFRCIITSGNISLNVALSGKWITKEEIDNTNWLPADFTKLPEIKSVLN